MEELCGLESPPQPTSRRPAITSPSAGQKVLDVLIFPPCADRSVRPSAPRPDAIPMSCLLAQALSASHAHATESSHSGAGTPVISPSRHRSLLSEHRHRFCAYVPYSCQHQNHIRRISYSATPYLTLFVKGGLREEKWRGWGDSPPVRSAQQVGPAAEVEDVIELPVGKNRDHFHRKDPVDGSQ